MIILYMYVYEYIIYIYVYNYIIYIITMIVNACFFLLQIFSATIIHTLRNSQDWVDVQAKTGSMLTLISNHAEVSKD